MSQMKLVAAGDVLLHDRVYNKCIKNGKYDFRDKMAPIKELLQAGDLSIVNLESIVAGKEFGLATYPRFNNPIEIAENLKEFGTDIVTNANNHSFDFGEEGVRKSIENLEKIGLPYVGSHKSKADKDTFRIFERNGIKVGVLAYSTVSNNKDFPKGKRYLLNRIIGGSTIPVRKVIERLKEEEKVDVVVAAVHFGPEYALNPSSFQVNLATSLSDAGADIILGHHPHVLQPAQWILNSRANKSLAIYSLGNLYTGQFGVYRQIGGVLSLEISKNEDGQVIIGQPEMDLTFVDDENNTNFQMHLFRDYIEENRRIKTDFGTFDSLEIYTELKNRLTQWVPDFKLR
ncbi:CapA family protein [Oceanobacillus jeddahense]|uniref:CapA family protein n=1 Tax=Oceanobacillus jeddahense TaxID=1462527 RepID=A0ABY5JQI4_9BACI|nr:CapA family protein [Oceanobacillus jeddahense]UUI02556.1 CapA family protein [Oceanobacillus jeddahense]